ncbi:MAG: HEAT repeat domain-containing protein [Candidatus Helarchaeota archaeon]
MTKEMNPVKKAISLVADGQNDEAVDILIDALDNEDWSVRSYAAQILGELGKISGETGKISKNIMEKALNKMLEKMKFDSDGWVREAITKAIGKMGSTLPNVLKMAIPSLINVLTKDEHDGARGSAANTLGTIGKNSPDLIKNAIDPLISALKDEAWLVRYYAVYAIGEIIEKYPDKKEVGLSKLKEVCNDEDPGVRDIAKETLKKLTS